MHCQCETPDLGAGASRRGFLGTALGAALFTALGAAAPMAYAAETALPDNRIGGKAALARLMHGNARYAAGHSRKRDYAIGRAARVRGQKPYAAILGCADSRVAPELVFDQGLGDLFVVRVAGNVADDDAIASMEYAVKFLDVPLVMVLGHSNCGAVASTLKVLQDKAVLPGHLPGLVDAIIPAAQAAMRRGGPNLLEEAIEQNVIETTARLATAAPILAPMHASGAVTMVGGLYDLASGKVALV
ncbi:carbonic anhydrase [Bordetella sp. FB-8]|uniref:carbonic anhydrase n=1 Tax=Bordetella sp. FB-8 TaxID=1159870 RepID=UPI00037CD6AB|nr:carbonic anhydrase [Bordetella sp. FB-8]